MSKIYFHFQRVSPASFWHGMTAPVKAFLLPFRFPRLLPLIVLPFALNVALYFVFFIKGSVFLDQQTQWALSRVSNSIPNWLASMGVVGFLAFFLAVIKFLILGFIAAITFSFVSAIVCAPFSEALSRNALMCLYRERGVKWIPKNHLGIVASIFIEVKKLGVMLFLALSAFAIGLVPLLQPIAFFIGLWALAFEYFGISVGLEKKGLLSVLLFLIANPMLTSGFGLALIVLMALPFTGLIAIPLCVLASTQLYFERTSQNYDSL